MKIHTEIPNIGLGTYMMSPDEAEKMTYEAIKVGYRIPLLERSADKKWGNESDYQEYKKGTPVLFPKLFNNIKQSNDNGN